MLFLNTLTPSPDSLSSSPLCHLVLTDSLLHHSATLSWQTLFFTTLPPSPDRLSSSPLCYLVLTDSLLHFFTTLPPSTDRLSSSPLCHLVMADSLLYHSATYSWQTLFVAILHLVLTDHTCISISQLTWNYQTDKPHEFRKISASFAQEIWVFYLLGFLATHCPTYHHSPWEQCIKTLNTGYGIFHHSQLLHCDT